MYFQLPNGMRKIRGTAQYCFEVPMDMLKILYINITFP